MLVLLILLILTIYSSDGISRRLLVDGAIPHTSTKEEEQMTLPSDAKLHALAPQMDQILKQVVRATPLKRYAIYPNINMENTIHLIPEGHCQMDKKKMELYYPYNYGLLGWYLRQFRDSTHAQNDIKFEQQRKYWKISYNYVDTLVAMINFERHCFTIENSEEWKASNKRFGSNRRNGTMFLIGQKKGGVTVSKKKDGYWIAVNDFISQQLYRETRNGIFTLMWREKT
eukprot:535079_1